MQLTSPEALTNDVLNQITDSHFNFSVQPYKVTVNTGRELMHQTANGQNLTDTFQQVLTDSLHILQNDYHQKFKLADYQTLQPNRYYLTIYEETPQGNLFRLVAPFGANYANILMSALIAGKASQMSDQEASQTFRIIAKHAMDNLAIHTVFSFYRPQVGSENTFDPDIVDTIKWEMIPTDYFNFIMRFQLPLNVTDPKLQAQINQAQQDHQSLLKNYEPNVLETLRSLMYDADNSKVTFVVSYY